MTLVANACTEPHRRTATAAVDREAPPKVLPAETPRPYRAAALEAARWLESTAIETEAGLTWPVAPGATVEPYRDARETTLYLGSSGVTWFFAELAHATDDAHALAIARRGGDHLLAWMQSELPAQERRDAGLYTGVAGVGWVLGRLAEIAGDSRYEAGARGAVDWLTRHADEATDTPETADGLPAAWGPSTDIISGAAGIGLFLLDAGRTLGSPHAIDLAAAAGRALIAQAEATDDGGYRWQMTPGFPRTMPNFSHGTAGIAYFLASLFLETGDQAFLDAALGGARHLLAIADVTATSCLIHHHEPGGETLYYLSWCHGPAGTGRLFHRLHQATGDDAWRVWLAKSAGGLEASGIPEQQTPGYWNNVGPCCGAAGVAWFLLGAEESLQDAKYRQLALRLADDLLLRAERTPAGLKWTHAEHRTRPELLAAQTGYMQGAAGIGLFLLDLDAVLHDGPRVAALPDSPFGAR